MVRPRFTWSEMPCAFGLNTIIGLMGFQHHENKEVTGKHQHHRASTNTLAGWSGRTPLRHWLLWRWIMEFLEVNPRPSPTKCSWLGIHPYLGHSKLNPRWLVDGYIWFYHIILDFRIYWHVSTFWQICVYFPLVHPPCRKTLGKIISLFSGSKGRLEFAQKMSPSWVWVMSVFQNGWVQRKKYIFCTIQVA